MHTYFFQRRTLKTQLLRPCEAAAGQAASQNRGQTISPMRMRARSHASQGEEKRCKYCSMVYIVNHDGGVVPALTTFGPQPLV